MHNIKDESYISRLIYRSIIGTITTDERKSLDQWLDADQDNRRFYQSLTDYRSLTEELVTRNVIDYTRPAQDMRLRIMARRRAAARRIVTRAAAVLIIICAAAAAAWLYTSAPSLAPSAEDMPSAPTAVNTAPRDIDQYRPGTTKATITNSAGQALALTADDAGSNGSSYFTDTPSQVRELCLDVPRGGEFKIILEDSTEVWLNSESSLRYPEMFSADERRVELTGEAYFHVHKDSDRPFYVESGKQVVRVYGTSFNIRAYPDEEATYTTLETGSISLSHHDGASGEVYLSTGHQAILDHSTDRINMTVVDPAIVTSWRHGRFVFEDQPLERIMRDLSRWYDFSYEFADDSLRSRVFMGSIPRYSDFRTAIQVLENCGGIHFALTPEGSILISPAK